MSGSRFFNIRGDVSTQLAPWVLIGMGQPIQTALFELRETLRMQSDIAGGVLTVQAAYVSDLASIPREAWAIFMAPDDPRIALGSWFHDTLYSNQGVVPLEAGGATALTRDQCDRILAFEAMADCGATSAEQEVVYLALKLFGQSHWDASTPPSTTTTTVTVVTTPAP